jgi:aryl-alcohol dehydrogenase-like predicted oxidoreductase
MSLSGSATRAGTNRYADRFERRAPGHFRIVEELQLSSIGIGTYLGDPSDETDASYRDAVIRAVTLGSNVIDSAANYRFQRSERAIGQALRQLTGELGFAREELVLCTKGGYIPFDGAPPRDVRAYIEETFVRPGIAQLSDFAGGSHCMTPAYLTNQLEQSLANLGVDCIDVYYIHNPESQLGFVTEGEFYDRLRRAFESLEAARAQNKIRSYGVATWSGFRTAPDSRSHHSLLRMAHLAEGVAGKEHGFKFIQLPFNLGMPEALTVPTQQVGGQQFSILEAARALGIAVVASASLLQGRAARGLPDEIREPLGSLTTDAQTAIQFVRSTPGITTALVGMSNPAHVEENLKLVAVSPAEPDALVRLFTER